MITPYTIAPGATTLISDEPGHDWFGLSNHSQTVTVYCAFDGTATVSGAAGARPGVPLIPLGTIFNQSDYRIVNPRARGIYVHNPSSTDSVIVSIQEI